MSEAQGNPDRERELRAEDEDRITALPQQKYLQPHSFPPPPPGPPPNKTNRLSVAEETLRKLEGRDVSEPKKQAGDAKKSEQPGEFHFPPLARETATPHFKYAPPAGRQRYSQILAESDPRPSQAGSGVTGSERSTTSNTGHQETSVTDGDAAGEAAPAPQTQPVRPPELAHLRTDVGGPVSRPPRPTSTIGPPSGFDFGFSETPTDFQRSLMRFAFPIPHEIDGGWSVEYGRPDLGYMLKEWATGGPDGRGVLGRRTAVYVCGPPAMRVGVANTVAKLQAEIWGDDMLEEIFLHTENYAL